jgi:hypothetical protein
MNTKNTKNKITSLSIWARLLIGILLLQAVVELSLGIAILVNLPATLEAGFGIGYTSELDILGIALGLYLLLLTALLALSAQWIYKRNYAGITIAMLSGIFLCTFGIAAFLKTGDAQGIYVDSIR